MRYVLTVQIKLLNPRRASTVAVIIFLSCRYRLIEVANMKWNIDQWICTPLLLPLLLLLLRLRLQNRIQDHINCHTSRQAHLAASRWEIPPFAWPGHVRAQDIKSTWAVSSSSTMHIRRNRSCPSNSRIHPPGHFTTYSSLVA